MYINESDVECHPCHAPCGPDDQLYHSLPEKRLYHSEQRVCNEPDIFLYIRSVEVANEVIVESNGAQVVKDTHTLIDSVNIVQSPPDRWGPPKYTAGEA